MKKKHSHIDSGRINFSSLFERHLAIANAFLSICILWSSALLLGIIPNISFETNFV